jgi:hypothetical protein
MITTDVKGKVTVTNHPIRLTLVVGSATVNSPPEYQIIDEDVKTAARFLLRELGYTDIKGLKIEHITS